MSTKSALAELRRKKRCIERAIRVLEKLQELEADRVPEDLTAHRTETPKVVVLPRRSSQH